MSKRFTYFIALIVFTFFSGDMVRAVNKIKTTEQFVLSSPDQLTSATNTNFSVYIGDDISGVTTPIKSLFFIVSGVYTGGGTVQLMLDADAASLQTFTLPAVASASSFEFVYKDPANKINPATAGSYSHSMTVIPSGVTISGVGVKTSLTHEYVPGNCDDGQSASEKIKTTEQFVLSSPDQLTSATSTNFSVYIGDDISGVTTPIKSLFFIVSGVYTGGGTVQLMLDADAASLQTFTLPAVASASSFEFVYKDPANKINPATAGSYSHSMTVIPSGVTISGMGVRNMISYRYKPPSCGTGYAILSDLTSAIFDSNDSGGPAYNSILWKGNLGGLSQNQGVVKFQMAVAASSTGPWNFVGGPTCASSDWYDPGVPDTAVELKCFPQLNNVRYFKYKVRVCSNDCVTNGNTTPAVDDVVLNWSP